MPLIGPHMPSDLTKVSDVASWSVRKKLLTSLIPSVMLVLLITGYVTNWFSGQYLNMALERTVRLLTLAQANALENLFETARQDLLELANGAVSRERFAQFLQTSRRLRGDLYRELAFIGVDPDEDIFFISLGNDAQEIGPRDISQIRPNPFLLANKLGELRPWETHVSEIAQASYPLSSRSMNGQYIQPIIRLSTPVESSEGNVVGYLILALNASRARDILSLYNSTSSPLYAFPRTAEKRYSFFFDLQGWMLFQSETPEEVDKELSTMSARAGLSGDHGKPGLDTAFRPNPEHEYFWRMVVDVQNGQPGLITLDPSTLLMAPSSSGSHSLGYAPVRFRSTPAGPPQMIGGVAYMDKSRLNLAAEMRQFDVMFIITVTAILLISLVIYLVSRMITKPILDLEGAVRAILREGKLREISLPDNDYETSSLKRAINRMIGALLAQREEIRIKTLHIHDAKQREPVDISAELPGDDQVCDNLVEIVGTSPAIESLKTQIVKAASVEADVLIIGETGSGKELAAEAIHKCSVRRNQPFISVNCGALDENLLLDALFGHVKGAFSEARTDRKGAFQTAHGGTLFLDEIGNASHKVQQALLRALSVRRIRPLGSDVEITVDVRLVAATNVDLLDSIRKGSFREDLYYRLKVITINPPPLRERRTDIPILSNYFLRDAASRMKRGELFFSRGALDTLMLHDWPGNVRELKNCITRAVAMAEGDIIQSEDLTFDERPMENAQEAPTMVAAPGERQAKPEKNPFDVPLPEQLDRSENASLPESPTAQAPDRSKAEAHAIDVVPGLNPRQRKALPHIIEQGEISRIEYQQLLEIDLPLRTAQYDLHDMVKKGILKKTGKGPATRYVVQKVHAFSR